MPFDFIEQGIARVRRIAPELLALWLLVVLAAASWIVALSILPRPLEVVSFSVGDGDCYLIRAPSGRTLLLDGGSRNVPDIGERVIVPNLLLLGVRKLDAILITHPDSDHLNGLPAVMEAVPVGMILDPGIPSETAPYQTVLELAKQRHIPHYVLRTGHQVNLGGTACLRILAPSEPFLHGTHSDTNNNCVVSRLEYGHARMLFTGDLELEGEAALLDRHPDLRAEVLAVAHHGSRYGTSEAFLNAVAPRIANISSRGDPGGEHPHAEVLARLRARNLTILRTDVNGQIQLTTDGRDWQVRTYRQAAETQ